MRCRAYFIQKDLFRSVKENGQTLFFTFLFAFLGAALGIYVGVKTDPQPEPGIFVLLFRLEYTPLAWTWHFCLRFFIYFFIAFFGYFFLHPWLLGGAGIFLFAKYISQTATLCIRFDPFFSAICSLVIIYLPLFICGGFLFFYLILDMLDKRSRCAVFTAKRFFRTFGRFFGLFVLYLLICLLLFVAICGMLYLILIAI